MSCLIGQATPNDALKQTFGAFAIVDLQRSPIVIPEIELREIAVKMLLGAMLVDALHAALKIEK